MKLTTVMYTAIISIAAFSSFCACDIVNVSEEKLDESGLTMCSPTITDKSLVPLFVVNGQIMHQDSVKMLEQELISSIDVLRGEKATNLYGAVGKNGVVLVKTDQKRFSYSGRK